MAQINVKIQAVRNDNLTLYSLIWQVEQCETAMNMLIKKVVEENFGMPGMQEELCLITATLRKIQEKMQNLYHITNQCMNQYIILENELEQRAEDFL